MHLSAPKPRKIGVLILVSIMNKITITNKEKTAQGWRFVVETPAGTEHTVTLDSDYYQELTSGDISAQVLIKKGFAFLLDNEPASAILSAFELKEIENYFPKFAETAKSFAQASD